MRWSSSERTGAHRTGTRGLHLAPGRGAHRAARVHRVGAGRRRRGLHGPARQDRHQDARPRADAQRPDRAHARRVDGRPPYVPDGERVHFGLDVQYTAHDTRLATTTANPPGVLAVTEDSGTIIVTVKLRNEYGQFTKTPVDFELNAFIEGTAVEGVDYRVVGFPRHQCQHPCSEFHTQVFQDRASPLSPAGPRQDLEHPVRAWIREYSAGVRGCTAGRNRALRDQRHRRPHETRLG